MRWNSTSQAFKRLLRATVKATSRTCLRVDSLEEKITPADPPLQFFYLPYPEQPMRSAMAILNGATGNDVVSITAVTAAADNTVVYYDHWEGSGGDIGYEADLAAPTQPSTQIWGDNDPANGIAPGFAVDLINSGDVVILQQTIPANPRNPANFFFDGGDKIGSSQTISISRANWPASPGAVLADASEVYDTRFWGTTYTAPVGENTISALQVFELSMFFVMASQDNTTLQIDHNADGIIDVTTTLNQGGSFVSPQAAVLNAGAKVFADKPVQVHLVTGDIGASYESRYFALQPDARLANDYYSPVGSVNTTDPYNLFIHNPNASAINVTIENTAGPTTLSVPANTTIQHIVTTLNSATHVFTPGGQKFAVVGAMDIDTTSGGSQVRDWGLALQPTASLSPVVVVAWAPGNDGTAVENGSPIWVTVESKARVYADFDGDPTTGLLIDPLGNRYDVHFDLSHLAIQRIYDNADNDQTGMRIYTLDGTKISAAYGQDPLTSSTGAPAIDAGYTVPAFPIPRLEKSVAFAPGGDQNGDGLFNSGDRLRYSIRIINEGLYPILNAVATDNLPPEVTYVPGTSTLDDGASSTPIPDSGATPFPLDESGFSISNIAVGGTPIVSFDIVINPALGPGTASITNSADLSFGLVLVRDVLTSDIDAAIGDFVWNDLDGDGVQDPGEPGVGSVTFDLYQDVNGDGLLDGGDLFIDTEVTDVNGRYQFIDLIEDNYIVVLTDTNNVLTTATRSFGVPVQPITLGPGQVFDTADHGFQFGTPDLVITKSDGGAIVQPGGVITYTLTIQNVGTVNAVGVVLSETVPTNATFDAAASSPGWNVTGTSFVIGNLPVNGSVNVTYALMVDNPMPAGVNEVSNTASVADDGTRGADPTPANNSSSDTTPIDAAPDLTIDKDDGGATVVPSGTIVYTLTVRNVGNQHATGVVISETVPANAAFNPALSEPGWNISGTSFNLGDFAVGSVATISYAVTVNNPISAGVNDISNTATVADDGTNGSDPTPANNSDSETTPVDAAPDLTIDKDDAGVSVVPGGTIIYSLTVRNLGNQDATGVVITETVPANTTFNAALSDPGWNASGTSFVIGNLAAGGLATIAYALNVNATVPAGVAQIDNTASIADDGSNGPDPTPANNSDPETTPVDAAPDLTIDKDDGGATAVPGGTIVYTLTIRNVGNQDATGVVISETVPANATFNPALSNPGWNASGTSLMLGNLAAGAVATVAYAVTVNNPLPPGTTSIDNAASVADDGTNGADPTPMDNSDPDSTPLVGGAIGDLVWLDLNADGIHDAGEPGISNVSVQATFFGGDGLPGGGDDVFYNSTTDASGTYSFTDLAPGNYRIDINSATLPEPLAPTFDLDGIATPHSALRDIAAGETADDLDFGYAGTATIGDRVWFDQNADGVQDAGEPGLVGVGLTLTWAGRDGSIGTGDDEVFSTATGADGSYTFNDLPAGAYRVDVNPATLPASMTSTFDPDGGGDDTANVLISSGGSNNAIDFGYAGIRSIGDRVWFDSNGNGTDDAGEPGLVGTTVELQFAGADGAFGNADDIVLTTSTGTGGAYAVNNLPDGNYQARVTGELPGGLAPTFDRDDVAPTIDGVANFALTGVSRDDIDFGLTGSLSIGDLVWLDLNADGIADLGEPELDGIDIALTFAGSDGIFGNANDLTFTTTTDATGAFQFSNLPSRLYRLAVDAADLPAGVAPTFDSDGTGTPDVSEFNLTADDLAQDFGYAGTGSIGDRIWDDADNGGDQNAGETGLNGIGVTLTWAGQDSALGTADDLTLTRVTAGDGNFQFDNLPAGPYHLAIDTGTLPAGVVPTFDPDGTLDHQTALTLAAGETRTDVDFGYSGFGSIAGMVYDDKNANGTFDAGDTGIENVTIRVTGTTNGGVNVDFTVLSPADGSFLISGLAPGTYRIAETQPAGYLDKDETVGGTGGVTVGTLEGNDAIRDIVVTAGVNLTGYNFGEVLPSAIRGFVYIDANNNGVKELGEAVMRGVRIRLAGTDDRGQFVSRAVLTNALGEYSFDDLRPGTYTVTEIQPARALDGRDTLGTPSLGANANTNDRFSGYVLTSGSISKNNNFGELTTTTQLGGSVYVDRNGNRVRDSGEAGIGGVVVRLTGVNDLGQFVRRNVVTDVYGRYRFLQLRPGTYTLAQIHPTMFVDGLDSVGTLGGVRSNDVIRQIVVAAGSIGNNYNFGERGVAATALSKRMFMPLISWMPAPGRGWIRVTPGGPGGGVIVP